MKKSAKPAIKRGILQMKSWCVTLGDTYFPISAVTFIIKVEDKSVRIGFPGANVDHLFKTRSERDKAHKILGNFIQQFSDSCVSSSAKRMKTTEEMVALQKKMMKECKEH